VKCFLSLEDYLKALEHNLKDYDDHLQEYDDHLQEYDDHLHASIRWQSADFDCVTQNGLFFTINHKITLHLRRLKGVL
jgi:hypothetical protein